MKASDEEQAVIRKYQRVVGQVPVGLLDTLRVLTTHCREELAALVDTVDGTPECTAEDPRPVRAQRLYCGVFCRDGKATVLGYPCALPYGHDPKTQPHANVHESREPA